MNRYTVRFAELAAHQQGAFIPFVSLGDPNPELSLQIVQTLIDAGADALELGIPFSDPLADGPTIQDANLRAFKAGINVACCFELLQQIRQYNATIPIGLLVYANLVFKGGIEHFYARCAQAGVDSVLIADVPLHESAPFREAAQQHHILPIFICPPNADEMTIQLLAQYGQGYTYLVSRAGVTGTELRADQPLTELISKLQAAGAPPVVQGFGIAKPSQVQSALQTGATGAIVGSAIVKLIAQYQQQPTELQQVLTHFVKKMKQATWR